MEYYKVLWFLLLGSTWSALAAAAGIPICAPGLLSCGTAGCYSSLLSTCMEWHGRKQCQPTGILQQLNLMVSASADRSSSSSSNMQAGGGSGFQLVPPAGIKNAAAGSSGRMPACFLAAALFLVLLLA
ncbi:hypothetical protein OEZ85_002447 [Tetradesmus obliquus]|uniref:CBM1 domain-containing protein n=1 Tax=Tetradesmus obliquus TaxID=3088 RepID=A0ABY8TXJ6_TETOB|nr:hypothetical protein OEZ85_002447 [Tetradesmus obliquus]